MRDVIAARKSGTQKKGVGFSILISGRKSGEEEAATEMEKNERGRAKGRVTRLRRIE
jgi:hypothetical protein